MEKKCKKAKWLSGEALQIAVKRREAKSKGEKERYSDGIVDLRRGIQVSSSVGPGKSILPFELPGRAGWELLSSHGRSK